METIAAQLPVQLGNSLRHQHISVFYATLTVLPVQEQAQHAILVGFLSLQDSRCIFQALPASQIVPAILLEQLEMSVQTVTDHVWAAPIQAQTVSPAILVTIDKLAQLYA